ncbi:hypothetical protein [Crenalkalicoccus roseus]|jgi:hypothetical membrane protein|uniref:hypothetical protein n=1 Tax=Crenalkalicoccus roseus TaxID=1485588 RepID=UPI0019599BC0|nr:hypothetical protein [Crenalkalicoccus roseus]
MMRGTLDFVIVLCVIVGAYALLALVGVFPRATVPLLLAIAGAFGAYLYGRYGNRGRLG